MSGRRLLPYGAPREEWLQRRRSLICASDVATIMGVGYGDLFTLWADKTGRLPDLPTTDAQARGLDLEAAVILHWISRYAEYEIKVRREGLWQAADYKRAGATVDRFSRCKFGRCIIEAKTQASVHDWGTDIEPEVPVIYQFQGQWQLFVTGRGHVHYIVMGPRFVPFERIMNRDDDLINEMACRAAKFWGRYVITDTAPPATAKDHDAITWMHPMPARGESYTLTDRTIDIMHGILEARAQVAEHQRWLDEYTAILQAEVGAATEVLWPDGSLAATWRPTRKIVGADRAWRSVHRDLVDRYGIERMVVDIDFPKLIADNRDTLPEGLRYGRVFLPKEVTE